MRLIYIPKKKPSIKYGLLYNWYAATDVRNITNTGWHTPSKAEYDSLSSHLGGNTIAGGKLKETGVVYWVTPNTGATNETNFNGRGSGGRLNTNGTFFAIKGTGFFWCNDTGSGDLTYQRYIGYDTDDFISSSDYKKYGKSIRLIKDSTTLSDGEEGTYTGNDGKVYRTICIGTQEWLADNLAETKYRFSGAKYQLSGNYPNDGEMQLIFNDVDGIPYPAILLHNIINGITISEIVEQILLDENYQYLKGLGYVEVSYDSENDKLAIYTLGISVFSGWGFWPLPYGTGLIISDYMTNSIPEVTDNSAWAALTTGALCAYNNDWSNV